LQKSDVLLMFYDTEKTGSPKYLYDLAAQYKERNNYDIRLIGFYDLQAIVDEEQYNNDFF